MIRIRKAEKQLMGFDGRLEVFEGGEARGAFVRFRRHGWACVHYSGEDALTCQLPTALMAARFALRGLEGIHGQ